MNAQPKAEPTEPETKLSEEAADAQVAILQSLGRTLNHVTTGTRHKREAGFEVPTASTVAEALAEMDQNRDIAPGEQAQRLFGSQAADVREKVAQLVELRVRSNPQKDPIYSARLAGETRDAVTSGDYDRAARAAMADWQERRAAAVREVCDLVAEEVVAAFAAEKEHRDARNAASENVAQLAKTARQLIPRLAKDLEKLAEQMGQSGVRYGLGDAGEIARFGREDLPRIQELLKTIR